MSRCKHCNKLTHSEHLTVEYDPEDQDKIFELSTLEGWTFVDMYKHKNIPAEEYGMLKCGDIYIHFKIKLNVKDN